MKNVTILMMVLGAAFTRLIPHVPNMTAVTAMALLGGAYLSSRTLAVIVPLAALFLSDLAIGFHSTMPFVYGAIVLISLLSFSFLRQDDRSVSRVAGSSLVASLIFFFITNLGVWMMDHLYAKTAEGLVTCFVMALPYLHTQILGDLFYTGLLFGAVEMVRRLKPVWMLS